MRRSFVSNSHGWLPLSQGHSSFVHINEKRSEYNRQDLTFRPRADEPLFVEDFTSRRNYTTPRLTGENLCTNKCSINPQTFH